MNATAMSILAASGETSPVKLVFGIILLVVIFLGIGIVKGKMKQAQRRVVQAGAKKAASALNSRMSDGSTGGK